MDREYSSLYIFTAICRCCLYLLVFSLLANTTAWFIWSLLWLKVSKVKRSLAKLSSSRTWSVAVWRNEQMSWKPKYNLATMQVPLYQPGIFHFLLLCFVMSFIHIWVTCRRSFSYFMSDYKESKSNNFFQILCSNLPVDCLLLSHW